MVEESVLLDVVRPVVVVEVEARLPYAHHPGMLRQLFQTRPALVVEECPLPADGTPRWRTPAGKRSARTTDCRDRARSMPDWMMRPTPAAAASADQHGGLFLAVVEMSVGIDEHRRGPCGERFGRPGRRPSVLDAREERRAHDDRQTRRAAGPSGPRPNSGQGDGSRLRRRVGGVGVSPSGGAGRRRPAPAPAVRGWQRRSAG